MDVVTELRCLGVTGILLTAAERGKIRKLKCQMPQCFCPAQLGGKSYFESVTSELSDWMPTHDHYPKLESRGGHRSIENTRLAHRLCNRMDGRPSKRDRARLETARRSASEGAQRRTVGLRREVALLLCGDGRAPVRRLVEAIHRWDGVVEEPYFDRGSGPTGIRLTRDGHRFANVFPGRSLQFAHSGSPLQGLGLPSESHIERDYQSIPVSELAERIDEALLLASYAYWRAGQ
jgi:hypothetical protein